MASVEQVEREDVPNVWADEVSHVARCNPHLPCMPNPFSPTDCSPEEWTKSSGVGTRRRIGVRRCVTFGPYSTGGAGIGCAAQTQAESEKTADAEVVIQMCQLHVSPTRRPVTPGLRFTSKTAVPALASSVAVGTATVPHVQQPGQRPCATDTVATSTGATHVLLMQPNTGSSNGRRPCGALGVPKDTSCCNVLTPLMSLRKQNGVRRNVTFSHTPNDSSTTAASELSIDVSDQARSNSAEAAGSMPASRAHSMPCSPLGRLPPLHDTSPNFCNCPANFRSVPPAAAEGACIGTSTDGLSPARGAVHRRVKKCVSFSAIGLNKVPSTGFGDYLTAEHSLAYVLQQEHLQPTSEASLTQSCPQKSGASNNILQPPGMQRLTSPFQHCPPIPATVRTMSSTPPSAVVLRTIPASVPAPKHEATGQLNYGGKFSAPDILQLEPASSAPASLTAAGRFGSIAASAVHQMPSSCSMAGLQNGTQGLPGDSSTAGCAPPTRCGRKASSVVSLPPLV